GDAPASLFRSALQRRPPGRRRCLERTMPADVFISYSRQDRDRVLPWVQRLQTAGVSVWMDEQGIDAARQWREEIVTAIEACKVLLLMISSSSTASEYVIKEVTLAADSNRPLVPLLLEPIPIPGALRFHLAGLQHITLFGTDEEEALNTLLRSLAR